VGDAIEEVNLFRDETVNLVWAVERTVASSSGEPWPGQERRAALPRPIVPPAKAALRYSVQTDVPHNWIPFVPVTLNPVSGEIALERAAMLDASVDPPQPISPAGKILNPANNPYQIREEEVSRSGVRVLRVPCRTRWIDGSTHVWMARMRRAAGGEGSSGLLFDSALEG
jgi:hypothetical protein